MSKENKTLWSKLSDAAKAGYEVLKTEMAALKIEMNETPASVKMGEVTLKDGTVLKYTGETLGEGSEVVLVTPEGEVPAPEGDLVHSDGSIITVSIQDGKSIVSAIKPMEQEAEMEAANAKQVSERVTKIVEKFEAQFKAVTEENKKLKTDLEVTKLKLAKIAGSVIKNTEMLIEFGQLETAEAIEKPFTPEGKTKKEILANKLK